MGVVENLHKLLNTQQLSHIRAIVFDLDGTLGPLPGWNGKEPLLKYITYPDLFLEMVRSLKDIHVVLVSRNGMFCGYNHMFHGYPQAKALGFDQVVHCSKGYPNTPKTMFLDQFEPHDVLLFDDQVTECRMAAAIGSYAIHALDVFNTIAQGEVDLYLPASLRQERRSTTRRRHH